MSTQDTAIDTKGLKIKILQSEGLPLAALYDRDSPVTFWNAPNDSTIRLPHREVWFDDARAFKGGSYRNTVLAAQIEQAIAQLRELVGATISVEICASMEGRIFADEPARRAHIMRAAG